MIKDTIVAISTPIGQGGISIVRLSGKNSIKISNKIVRPFSGVEIKELESHKLTLSKIYKTQENNKLVLIDEALVSVMKAPNSYTGEDVVEINCHGGCAVSNIILKELIKHGARIASPGEFTKRAFLNGKIDLSKAESVINIINAETENEVLSVSHSLDGTLNKKIDYIKKKVIEMAARISASLDFPDEIDDIDIQNFLDNLIKIKDDVHLLIESYNVVNFIKTGINVVIVGKPNVGKSSIFNKMVRYDKAIVSNISGTTRDIVEEKININGIKINLKDTAGIRTSNDPIEKIGIDKTIASLDECDLVIFVCDAKTKIDHVDLEILKLVENKDLLLLINKSDAIKHSDKEIIKKEITNKLGMNKALWFSAIDKKEVFELEEIIYSKFVNSISFDQKKTYITSLRQKEILEKIFSLLFKCETMISSENYDIIYSFLEEIVQKLDSLVGLDAKDEIIEEVFSNFCVGK